jgi:hypothetical protein
MILGRWDVVDYFRIDHFPATPTCRARVRILFVILKDIATVFSLFWMPRLSTLRSSRGARISSITGTIGKRTRRGKNLADCKQKKPAAHLSEGIDLAMRNRGEDSRRQTGSSDAPCETRRGAVAKSEHGTS